MRSLLLLWLAQAGSAWAADDEPLRVGRLAATQGPVWLLDRSDEAEGEPRSSRQDRERANGRDTWHDSREASLVNWPLGRGDRLRTGAAGRAVLQLDSLTLRLGADSELHIEQLDAGQLRLWLPRGDLALHVLADPGTRAIELRTPEGRLWPRRAGHYRASRVHDSTQATAWDGEWHFDADDSALSLGEGRRADFWLQGRPPRTHHAWTGVDRDDFADWARREARADTAPAAALPADLASLPGAGDLQRWGDWRDDPEAGRVWQPRQLPPGWAPYRDGRWVWLSPWGWTWIDAARWGFTPFHYGQWLLLGGRWCWSPGPVVPRHRYRPVQPGWSHARPQPQPLLPHPMPPRQLHPPPVHRPPVHQPLLPPQPVPHQAPRQHVPHHAPQHQAPQHHVPERHVPHHNVLQHHSPQQPAAPAPLAPPAQVPPPAPLAAPPKPAMPAAPVPVMPPPAAPAQAAPPVASPRPMRGEREREPRSAEQGPRRHGDRAQHAPH
ncbi:DUF6600 domain-containing protein [Aquabacterium sp. OR-4]|uniref:DUF6600 domain-containing protein n=1 Tax=Aquabacterium sp. OR-4 TaxID=2978127 RepID=UPI0028C968F8|nr:DUF6600 domain-containing protein [Aquabacterium sp. OR-4]MDT7834879.1 hypothetical protein [Aquabacterium sp. OR-4]